MKRETIQLFKVFMSENAAPEVSKVLNSGYIGQGEKVEQFESKLQDFFMKDYIVTLNSGTSGLHLALDLLKKSSGKWPGLEDGDEVLATSLTCTASNFPILANNLNIKWVDVDPTTLNMDLDDLSRKISPKTKAIMLVHWGGYPNDLDRIKEIQNKCFELYGFKPAVIEDGAHSFGSKYKGKHIGNHGNMTMYSLQAIKHITAIDGGLLLLPHQELYDRAKLLRWYGIDRNSNRKDFRWIKQNLTIKTLWGHSENAVAIHIWVAICTYLIVAYVKYSLKSTLSIYEIIQILGISVFDKAPVKELITELEVNQNFKEQYDLFNDQF